MWNVICGSYVPTSAVFHYNEIIVEHGSPGAESLCLTLQNNNGKEIALSRD